MSPKSFARRQQSLGRRKPQLTVRSTLLIICEGQKTEPSYFAHLRSQHRNDLIRLQIDNKGGVPKTLVERAADIKRRARREALRSRDDTLNVDEVWCVFDVDEHPNLDEARRQARDNGISVAISNPSFEIWLLLHFQDQNAFITRERAREACQGHLTDYRKDVSTALYGVLAQNYEQAVRRAVALEGMHQNNRSQPFENPSTSVFRLTERIKTLGKGEHIANISS